MKQNNLMKLLAAGAVSAIALTTAFAQTSTTSTTTSNADTAVTSTTTSTLDGTGTITAYTPGTDYISFRTETSSSPVKYYYTKNTTIVDPEGKTVEWSMLKPDMPVNYTYVKEGDRMVVSKITLSKPVACTTKRRPRRRRRPSPKGGHRFEL